MATDRFSVRILRLCLASVVVPGDDFTDAGSQVQQCPAFTSREPQKDSQMINSASLHADSSLACSGLAGLGHASW